MKKNCLSTDSEIIIFNVKIAFYVFNVLWMVRKVWIHA